MKENAKSIKLLSCMFSALHSASSVFTSSRQARNSRERTETEPWDESNRKEQNQTLQEREEKWR
jgi:hypothetical protein